MSRSSQTRLDLVQQSAVQEISEHERQSAIEVLEQQRVALFIVAYNAEHLLPSVLERIPVEVRERLAEVFIIDDSSTDRTFEVATGLSRVPGLEGLRVYRTPFNRGYGGNQKLGYLYCQRKGFDIVILMHGDGQYAPEYLPRILAGFAEPCDAVFASRMLNRRRALKGGMPIYKWIANQLLTRIGNRVLGTRLSEFHSGFRAFRLQSLSRVPFAFNSDGFHFDTEIIAQAAAAGWCIREVDIPTYYGEEKCHVVGAHYAWNMLLSLLRFRLVGLGLFYRRNFDLGLFDEDHYHFKTSSRSLHQYVLRTVTPAPQLTTVELGAHHGVLSAHVAEQVGHHVAVDLEAPDRAGDSEVLAVDLEGAFADRLGGGRFDVVIALDVIEHLSSPEHFLGEAFRLLKPDGRLYLSTANVAYLLVRFALLCGQFNYGKRGILDMTHKRLLTVGSAITLLEQFGFRVDRVRGFPPPLTDLVSPGVVMRLVESTHAALSRWLPRLFAFNFLLTATRMDSVDEIFDRTMASSENGADEDVS